MQQCPSCGVELEDAVTVCPLCETELPQTDSRQQPHPGQTEGGDGTEAISGSEPASESRSEPTEPAWRQRLWLWEIIGVLSIAVIVVTLAADFASGTDIGWSLYPIAAVGAFWVLATALILFFDRPILIYLVGVVDMVGLLLVLSLITPGPPWFVSLGLPLAGLLTLIVVATATVIRLAHLDAIQIITIMLLATGLFLIGLEAILSVYLAAKLLVSWSLVASACAISLALILIVVRRRLRKRHVDLKRLFHV